MNKLIKILPILLITIMVLISFFSVREDSAIMDEVAHIPAGYSYLKFQDYRLNPEHPPLLKMLAGAPLLFLDLKFPLEHPAWKQDVNGQWEAGYQFLYHLGNDADKMLFWSRLPIIALLILLGIYVWKWSKELLGKKWALAPLFLFAFSPTILAHSHYVTTDLGATCFIFIAFYYFVKYLKNPSLKNVVLAGLTLGLAQVSKFSAVLLFFCFLGLSLIPFLFNKKTALSWGKLRKTSCPPVPGVGRRVGLLWGKHIAISSGKFALIILICLGVILIVYEPTVFHFSREKQQELIRGSIGPEKIENLLIKLSNLPGGRGLTQYLLGVTMVFARVGGGNTAYFLGKVSNLGWWYYFPVCFFLKETISILVLTGLAFLFTMRKFIAHLITKKPRQWWSWLKEYSLSHISEIAMICFIIVYGVASMKGKLNIGIRHIMVFSPFIYILIVKEFKRRLSETQYKKIFTGLFIFLLAWIAVEVSISFPSYLAYYNELIGNPRNGYKYITDSNLDWGQDLRRLSQWVDEKGIEKIKVDYFGGGVPVYYLDDKYVEWHSNWGPTTGWIAVSATYFSESIYRQDTSFAQSYYYLEVRKPEAIIGNSILVYYIP